MSFAEDYVELPTGAMLTYSQAAAALANVAVYCHAFGMQLQQKAAERGITTDDLYAIAALEHISDITAAASANHAKRIGDEVRQQAFAENLPAMYHIMNVEQALEVQDVQREGALAGAIPVLGGE